MNRMFDGTSDARKPAAKGWYSRWKAITFAAFAAVCESHPSHRVLAMIHAVIVFAQLASFPLSGTPEYPWSHGHLMMRPLSMALRFLSLTQYDRVVPKVSRISV